MDSTEVFLALIRLGIGHQSSFINQPIEWTEIKALAEQQGLSAIVVDGIELLPESTRPPKQLLLEWIGEVLQGYEYRYELYRRAIGELAEFYNAHGFKMMVLKGLTCSLDWPKPEHRPCGDIDIWLFGHQKEADAALEAEKPVQVVQVVQEFKVDRSHHHHTVFYWRDFMVENHYDFVNVHAHKSSKELEKVFKDLGKDDSHFIEIYGEKVYLPSPNLHALFLFRHLVSHFASSNINFRQVIDWAFFVEKHAKEVDWEWLMGILKKYHMEDFFNCLNAICVEDLGFSKNLFPVAKFIPSMKDKVLNDIISPAFDADDPAYLIPRIIYRFRRWKGNGWKHKLCYNESRTGTFLRGIWARLLKPSSI